MAAVAAMAALNSITSSSPSLSSCLVAPRIPKSIGSLSLRSSQRFTSLAFSSNLSSISFAAGNAFSSAVEKTAVPRRSVVCEAAPTNKADSAVKRARQAEKRRIYNKSRKSEIKTRMRKVFEELDALQKKTDAKAEEIVPIEKLISVAYSVIDKAVKVGTLHRNTGAHRKSRLARKKKSVEIHHGWYTPATTVTA